MLSWCCDAPEWLDETCICSACKEHCDFYDEDEDEDYPCDIINEF